MSAIGPDPGTAASDRAPTASPPRPYARPNRFVIDLSRVAACTRQIRRLVGPQVFFFATLKSDAYGYGLLPAARTVLAAGADALSLATLEDAIALRGAGITQPILLYAGSLPDAELVEAAQRYRLIATVYDEAGLQAFATHARGDIEMAVKVEVGPERIGVPAEHAAAFVRELVACRHLKLRVLNAHPNLAARGGTRDCLDWQFERFRGVLDELARLGIDVPLRVLASSKVLRLTGAAMSLNAVDPGAALFQAIEDEAAGGHPFHALTSRLIQVRELTRERFLDEAPFEMRPGMRIGVLPIGYSDGIARVHAGQVLVRGRRVPILGAPALEYTRVDLSHVPDAAVGDEVVLIGRQGDQQIAAEEAVRHQGAARVADLALEIKPSVPRTWLAAA